MQIRNFDVSDNADTLSVNGNEPPTKKRKKESRKTEKEVKLDLIKSIIKNEGDLDYTELSVKAQNVKEKEDAVKVILDYERLIKTQKPNVRLACQQGFVLKKYKESAKFSTMVHELRISKSTIVFKISLFELVHKYPKLIHSTLSLNYFKNYFKSIKAICKKSVNEFKLE